MANFTKLLSFYHVKTEFSILASFWMITCSIALQDKIQKSLLQEEDVHKVKAQYIWSTKCLDILPDVSHRKLMGNVSV